MNQVLKGTTGSKFECESIKFVFEIFGSRLTVTTLCTLQQKPDIHFIVPRTLEAELHVHTLYFSVFAAITHLLHLQPEKI